MTSMLMFCFAFRLSLLSTHTIETQHRQYSILRGKKRRTKHDSVQSQSQGERLTLLHFNVDVANTKNRSISLVTTKLIHLEAFFPALVFVHVFLCLTVFLHSNISFYILKIVYLNPKFSLLNRITDLALIPYIFVIYN